MDYYDNTALRNENRALRDRNDDLTYEARASRKTLDILRLWVNGVYGEELRDALDERAKIAHNNPHGDNEWTENFRNQVEKAQITRDDYIELAFIFLRSIGFKIAMPDTNGSTFK